MCVCLYTYVYVTLYPNISAQIQTKHQTNKQTNNKQTDKQTNKVKSHMIWTHRNLKNLKNTIAVYRTRSNKGLQNWQNCNLGDPQYAVKIPKGTYVFSKIYLGSQKKKPNKRRFGIDSKCTEVNKQMNMFREVCAYDHGWENRVDTLKHVQCVLQRTQHQL